MSILFRRATRDGVNLLIGLVAPSGGGKTYTALRLASGLAGGKPFAFIDSEARRGKHYADQFAFDYHELTAPFTPERYSEAILAAEEAGYEVAVVDSMSHEWFGEGGILEMQEAEIERMAKGDFEKAERVKMASWIKPKARHKKMVQRVLQTRMHLILCFRAEEKMEPTKDSKGRMQMTLKKSLTGVDGWMPITEKMFPYELTVSVLLLPSAPGVPKAIKVQEQHAAMFPPDAVINEDSGKLIAVWARGDASEDEDQSVEVITLDQVTFINDLLTERSISVAKFCAKAGCKTVDGLPSGNYSRALDWIQKQGGG